MIEKKTWVDYVFDTFNHLLMAALAFVTLYPFWYVLCASFSDPNLFIRKDFVLLFKPLGWSLEAYRQCLTPRVMTGYSNTLCYVVAGTMLSMILTFLGAYALSRKGWLGKRFITLMIMFTMYFSGGIIAIYLWVEQLGMIDPRWAILLPTALTTYNMIVMRTAFASVPERLIEAAKLDGAGEFTCLFRIVIPLSQATIAVVVLFYAVWRWNDWMSATIFLRSADFYPLQIFLREILLTSSADSIVSTGGNSVNTTALAEIIKYATIVVATVPVLCIYPFIQKYFVSGVMIGGVKE